MATHVPPQPDATYCSQAASVVLVSLQLAYSQRYISRTYPCTHILANTCTHIPLHTYSCKHTHIPMHTHLTPAHTFLQTHIQFPQQRAPKYKYTPNDYLTCTIITATLCGLFSPLSIMFTIPAFIFARKVRVHRL